MRAQFRPSSPSRQAGNSQDCSTADRKEQLLVSITGETFVTLCQQSSPYVSQPLLLVPVGPRLGTDDALGS